MVVADVDSEAPSCSDDPGGIEAEAPLGAGDEDDDVLSSSVEPPLVFGVFPKESSDPASADEPGAVEFARASDETVPEEGLTPVPDAAVAGGAFAPPP
jgi:hypothetical protein